MLDVKKLFTKILTTLKNKVSKTGDIMSGDLVIKQANSDSKVQATNGTQKIELRCTTGGYRGIYDPVLQKWLIQINPDDIVSIASPIYSNLIIDRSSSDTATSAALKVIAGAGSGAEGNAISIYAATGSTKGLYSYGTATNNENEWIIWYNADDDAVYLNDKYCKRTVHSDTSDLYSETIKYSDGRLITNMRATVTANCTSSGFGGYYNSSVIGMPSFPVAYTTGTIPTVTTTVRHINDQSVYTLLAQNVSSRTNPGGIYVMRRSSGTGTIEVDIHAEGVWK